LRDRRNPNATGRQATAWPFAARRTPSAGLLRIPPEVEEQGLDLTEIPATPYPEGIPVTAMRSTSGTAVLSVGEEVK